MGKENFIRLAEHMIWADNLVYESLFNSPAKDDEKLKYLTIHTHIVQYAFCCLWTNEKMEIKQRADKLPPLEEIHQFGVAQHERILNFLTNANDEDFKRKIVVPWAQKAEDRGIKTDTISIEDSILQVMMHSQYHRGQINQKLRELGGTPPMVDYIAWVWGN